MNSTKNIVLESIDYVLDYETLVAKRRHLSSELLRQSYETYRLMKASMNLYAVQLDCIEIRMGSLAQRVQWYMHASCEAALKDDWVNAAYLYYKGRDEAEAFQEQKTCYKVAIILSLSQARSVNGFVDYFVKLSEVTLEEFSLDTKRLEQTTFATFEPSQEIMQMQALCKLWISTIQEVGRYVSELRGMCLPVDFEPEPREKFVNRLSRVVDRSLSIELPGKRQLLQDPGTGPS